MRIVPFTISAIITIVLIYALNRGWNSTPPFGSFFSPQHGFWQNAEPVNLPSELQLNFPQLKGKTEVYFDERLVPHIFAEQDNDAFFVQGYLHAKYRLWQMEFQTHAAAGRLSEILGPGKDSIYLNFDRQMRRLGMVYGAKNSLERTERDPETKAVCDAYTAGVNAYISSLTTAQLPIEYKLLNYAPEPWSNLKTALFLKYMCYDLAAGESDFEYTNAKAILSKEDFEKLYPARSDSLDPVIPRGTHFDSAAMKPVMPASADSLYFNWKETTSLIQQKPDRNNGSNNWVLAGSRTASGKPILCNDPHLGLNLPSLWFEMQITTPQFNAYGASFPGAPCIIIGFNDNCAFGFTNAARDVRDYYAIQFRDDTRREYRFNGEWRRSDLRIDTFHIEGGSVVYDTVAYTLFGPVMFDRSFTGLGTKRTDGKNYAVRWKAHDPSNELRAFYKLDYARGYADYYNAIQDLSCPGQNCAFASKSDTIAIWQQGVFPAKWKRQGDFIMPGIDSSYMWQGYIPNAENPHLVNPERGFVSSANQMPADSAYPYYLGGSYDLYRGKMINRYLSQSSAFTVADMKRLQTDNYNLLAETALPLLLRSIDENRLDASEKKYLGIVRTWNRRNDPQERGVGVFIDWFDSLGVEIFADELSKVPQPTAAPEEYTLIEALLHDSSFQFIDNIHTPGRETLQDVVTIAFKKAAKNIDAAAKEGRLQWGKYKDSGIRHLLRLEPFSRYHLVTGGGTNVIDAIEQYHGPSWRMIVQLTDSTEAFGIYPGGQDGNPGSRFYENFIDDWIAGKYYPLWVMKRQQKNDPRIITTVRFSK